MRASTLLPATFGRPAPPRVCGLTTGFGAGLSEPQTRTTSPPVTALQRPERRVCGFTAPYPHPHRRAVQARALWPGVGQRDRPSAVPPVPAVPLPHLTCNNSRDRGVPACPCLSLSTRWTAETARHAPLARAQRQWSSRRGRGGKTRRGSTHPPTGLSGPPATPPGDLPWQGSTQLSARKWGQGSAQGTFPVTPTLPCLLPCPLACPVTGNGLPRHVRIDRRGHPAGR